MATGRRTISDKADEAIKGAATVATPKKQADKKGRVPQAGKLISLRIDPVELDKMKEVFNENGVTLAGGVKLCALHAFQEIEAGKLRITKAGIMPRR
jgi:hypothetical protein